MLVDVIKSAATLGGGIRRVNLDLYGPVGEKGGDKLALYQLDNIRYFHLGGKVDFTHPWIRRVQK